MGKNKCADPEKAMPLFNELLDYQKSQLNNDFTGLWGYDSGEAGCIIHLRVLMLFKNGKPIVING